jgi:hypothetical protein
MIAIADDRAIARARRTLHYRCGCRGENRLLGRDFERHFRLLVHLTRFGLCARRASG